MKLSLSKIADYLSQPFPSFHPDDQSPILIYGAGNMGKALMKALRSRKLNLIGLMDRQAKTGDSLDGIPVYSPDDFPLSLEDRMQITALIAIHNRDVFVPEIIKALTGYGFKQVLSPVEWFDEFAQDLGDRYWLTRRKKYLEYEKDIIEGYKLWEDENSRQLYLQTMTFRLTGDYSLLPQPDRERQYFPVDIPSWKLPLRLVDCGAYDGDTLLAFHKSHIPIEAVAAFEPDLPNFTKLAQMVNRGDYPQVYLWPCGVYSSSVQLRFAASQGEASQLLEQGSGVVQCIALDDAIPGFKPNLIKMDIEGGEVEALKGAKNIIEGERPGLAICVYHTPAHLWQIPLMINSWGLGYRFYLRAHGFNDFDTVMYAVREP